jgi:protein TonB
MSVATPKCWKSDRRGWLPALLITAAAHAGVFLQVDSGLFAARQTASVPVVRLTLLATPAVKSQAVPESQPAPPAAQPEPVVKKPVRNPQPEPVRQKQAVQPERVNTQPPVLQDNLQAMTRSAPPAAGPVVVAELPVDPPHTAAAYLNNPPPTYPKMLLRRGVEGAVLVRAQVQDDGRCTQVQLKESSGFNLFDEAALSAVQDWRFVPARKGAQNVVAWVDVPIAFRIDRSR